MAKKFNNNFNKSQKFELWWVSKQDWGESVHAHLRQMHWDIRAQIFYSTLFKAHIFDIFQIFELFGIAFVGKKCGPSIILPPCFKNKPKYDLTRQKRARVVWVNLGLLVLWTPFWFITLTCRFPDEGSCLQSKIAKLTLKK